MKNVTEPLIQPLYSIGHSNHELEQFVALLQQHRITAVADVRSSPFSRRLPQFNIAQLSAALRKHDIAHVFLGDQLGGRPSDRGLYHEEGRVDYERVRQTEFFQQGLERLLHGMEKYTVAMMCGEADPLDCHRGLMITPALKEQGISPLHLRRDGTVETTEEMEQRLLLATGLQEVLEGLFAPLLSDEEREENLRQAYREMSRKKAFRLDLNNPALATRDEQEPPT